MRRFRVVPLALGLLGALAAPTSAQTFDHPAQGANSQILALSGGSVVGETVTATVTTEPGARVTYFVATAPGSTALPDGQVVNIDLATIIKLDVAEADATGVAVSTAVLTGLDPGDRALVQCGTITSRGIVLTNVSEVVLQGPVTPPIDYLQLTGVRRATAEPSVTLTGVAATRGRARSRSPAARYRSR